MITVAIPMIVRYQRRRHTRAGHGYNPKEYTDGKRAMSEYMRAACAAPLEGPLVVEMTFARAPAKSNARKCKEGELYPDTRRPDVDNLMKAVLDAGNGILWMDDSQVVRVVASKVVGLALHNSTFVRVWSQAGGQ